MKTEIANTAKILQTRNQGKEEFILNLLITLIENVRQGKKMDFSFELSLPVGHLSGLINNIYELEDENIRMAGLLEKGRGVLNRAGPSYL